MSEQLTPAIQYFLRHLEKQAELVQQAQQTKEPEKDLSLENIEHFFRTLKSQNIFIFIVGVNGKRESSSLPKIIFSLSRVVRIYYSLSLDTNNAGFLRIRIEKSEGVIVVERLHGYRPRPERLYASHNECHIIRFMTHWILRRVDWDKTKLKNLQLYKKYIEMRQRQEGKRQQEQEDKRPQEQEDQEELNAHQLKKVIQKAKKATS